jgi:GLPGLI family protein
MKTIILLSATTFLSINAFCQEPAVSPVTSGKVTYQEKVKLDIKLEGDAAQFSESLPKEQTFDKVLYFNPDYSLYQTDDSKKSDEMMTQPQGQMTIRMVISGGNDKTFYDLKKGKKTEQKEFMTRMFLIEGDLGTSDWKLTGNSGTILGYNCQEATKEDKEKKISAWFTTSIPVSSGPAGYAGLPGLVLKVDIDNGKRTITATSIDQNFNSTELLKKPSDGKKVSADEYKKIVDEKMKEMGAEAGEGGAHVMIRIKN